MIKVTATAKILWLVDDADLPDDKPMDVDEIKAKFTEEFDKEMKNSLDAAEVSIETFEIRQEA